MIRLIKGLELERREIQLVGAFERSERDGEILDREARRVKSGDLVFAAPALRGPGEHVSELRHVVARDAAGLDRVREIPVVGCLLKAMDK